MTRSFLDTPVADDALHRVVAAARRAPAAGNTDALDLLVLVGPAETARYWDLTLPASRRQDFAFPGLLRAPVLVVPWVRPAAYVERYAEPDKARTGLGAAEDVWPVPYWWVDAGQAAGFVQLAAIAEGLGVCLFGIFDHETAVRDRFGVPSDRRAIGTIALGHPGPDERPGRSATRGVRALDETVHRGHWR